ncbi:hypothetical protein GMOD_00009018 [Pyrenophora seminiperda CCB06]|uniref:Uncharacterized protein n=1 Tax=Pyrenophora seminiperda CCB06 TaxID=1302712 RepID=A0A3M7MFQ5_9PLEO|nr:hypothetical protein GMOD_00009018 [Pyrenophora seminiperda CCB06]
MFDPFRRLPPIPTPFSYTNYLPPHPATHHHHHHHRRTHHYRPQRSSSYYADVDPPTPLLSDQDDIMQEDAYYMDATPPSDDYPPFLQHHHHRHHRRPEWTPDTTTPTITTPTNRFVVDPENDFRRTTVRLPRRMAEKMEREAVLVLPPTLTRLRVHIRSSSYGGGGGGTMDPLHVAVAGDMRFRDVVKQLVGARGGQGQGHMEVRAFVRMRGSWVEPGAARVSEVVEQGRWVVDERGEVEVKIEVSGGASGGGGVEREGRGKRAVKAWEREVGRSWEIRG